MRASRNLWRLLYRISGESGLYGCVRFAVCWRRRFRMAQLNVGFILARRFTLCAFANFVDVLRLAADEGDRSRPILCAWRVLSPTMDPIASSCGHRRSSPTSGSATRRASTISSSSAGWSTRSRTCIPTPCASSSARPRPGVPLVGVCTGTFVAAPRRADAGLPRLRQLVPPRGLPRAVRRAGAGLRPDLRRRPRPADLLGRGLLGASRGLHRRAAPRTGAGGEEPAHHDHRRGDGGGGAAARHAAGARHRRRAGPEGAPRHAAVDRRAALDRPGGGAARGQPAQARAALPRGARA